MECGGCRISIRSIDIIDVFRYSIKGYYRLPNLSDTTVLGGYGEVEGYEYLEDYR